MKYYVSFQEFNKGNGRPIDHVTDSDFETDGLGMLPNVGDYVHLVRTSSTSPAATFDGKVRSRLFRYIALPDGTQTCGVNIVVDPTDDGKWGEVIKE